MPQAEPEQDTGAKLESTEATAVLYALASLISTDIAAIEARHASNQEMSLLRLFDTFRNDPQIERLTNIDD